MSFKIDLSRISDVKNFVQIAVQIPNPILVRSEKYCVNGKSLLGLFSLDLSKSVEIEVIGDLNPAYEHELKKFESKEKFVNTDLYVK